MAANPDDAQDCDNAAYLAEIGARVRSIRARRGMSRRLLAEASRVSERYLADLENGKGNISVLRLRDIAGAMSVPVEDLVSEPVHDSPDYAFILQYLRHAAPEELDRLHRALAGNDGVTRRFVALIGLRGAGKSTLGRALAARLRLPLVELVDEIETRAGMAVSEIFSLGGQATYRRLERECLERVIESSPGAVIAVGGSLVSEAASYARLLSECVTVWLRAAPSDHMRRVIAQGDQRPMAGHSRAMDDLQRILIEREALYERAHHVIDTSGHTVTESLEGILAFAGIAGLASNQEAVTP
ncbi:MAG: helix-turn-helix transcriptional regulator [Gammaproteobacteria bacterium]